MGLNLPLPLLKNKINYIINSKVFKQTQIKPKVSKYKVNYVLEQPWK